jgi:hypothetical protein
VYNILANFIVSFFKYIMDLLLLNVEGSFSS